MKKKYIYNEFTSMAKFYGGINRKAIKMYEFKLCEKLGGIDYRKPFAMYCSRKRVEVFQPTRELARMQYDNILVLAAKANDNGSFYYFGKDQEKAILFDDYKPLLKAYSDYIRENCSDNAA